MDQNDVSVGAPGGDRDTLSSLLGSLSDSAAQAATDALDAMLADAGISRSSAGPFAGRLDVERLLSAIADILSRQSGGAPRGSRISSVNQIAAALTRAVQRGARFT